MPAATAHLRVDGSERMNPFTTDHPLTSRSSWFAKREHPVLSFACSTFVLALVLTPFVLHRLYLYSISDIGAEANPFPEPWWSLFWGSLIAFVLSVMCAIPPILFCRLLARKPGAAAFGGRQ